MGKVLEVVHPNLHVLDLIEGLWSSQLMLKIVCLFDLRFGSKGCLVMLKAYMIEMTHRDP